MSKKFHVYGLGNAIVDLQLNVLEEDIGKLHLDKGRMHLVSIEDQKRIFSYFGARLDKQASGGSAANTMIALSQLGASVAYSCMVGEDSLGEFYFEEMKSLGVSLHTKPCAGKQTGTSVILVTPDAERTMNTHLGASVELQPDDVSEQHIASSSWLYIEGYLFSQENGRAVVERALTLAKKHQCRVAITFSDSFIVDLFREPLETAVSQASLIFANRHEGAQFTGKTKDEDIFTALCERVPNVALTLGADGALGFFNGESCRVASVPTKAIDDTGAGDIFAGAFLYGLTQGWSCKQATTLGCVLASRVVSQMGPRLSGDLRTFREDARIV